MNVIEAAATGAANAIPLVANIAANLIAFLAFLAFIDAILSYVGSMVEHPELSFKVGNSNYSMILVCIISIS